MQRQGKRTLDPRLLSIREELLSREAGLPPFPEPEKGRSHAAVCLILRERAELEVLMIRRAESEGDPWSGQMALPGGRRDPSDSSLLHTAVRETAEETSVALAVDGLHLGRLEEVTPATHRLPPISIFPFVFGVRPHTDARAASREVDDIYWIPLATLRNPGATGTVEIRYRDDTSKEFPCLRVEGRVIWGLTYRILTGFFSILEALEYEENR